MSHIENIKNIFDAYHSKPYGTRAPSAVLVPFIDINGQINVIFTQRALDMLYQPGDICFPGGHHEGNETPEDTALRETWEEISIPKKDIEIIGRPDFFITKYGAYVIPIIGIVKPYALDHIKTSPAEVEKLILIPLSFFMETTPVSSFMTLNREFPEDFPFEMIYGGKNYKFAPIKEKHYFYNYNGIYIWGLTAKIIKNVAEIIKNNNISI